MFATYPEGLAAAFFTSAPLMFLCLSREVNLKVPKWPGWTSSGCYWSWLGKWLLFCCVFVPTCLPPPLRKWRNDVTQPQIPALFSAWFTSQASLIPPLVSLSGLNLWKAKNKAAGGGGVQGRRRHNDSLFANSAADATWNY